MKKARKLTLSALTAAAARALTTGVANAAVVLPSTGDGELFVTAWDSVRNVSYSRQLEVNLSAFTGGSSLSFAGDPLFTTTFTGSGASDIQWNLVAADSVVTTGSSQNANGSLRLLTTSTNSAPSGISLTNSGLNTVTLAVNNFATALNNMGCDVNASCATSDPNDFGFGGSSNFSTHLGLVGGISSAGTGFGSSLNFWYLTGGGGNIATQVSKTRFNDVTGAPALWTLAANGDLTYTVAPIAPIPVPAAVWLFGSGLVGLVGIARRRRQAAALA